MWGDHYFRMKPNSTNKRHRTFTTPPISSTLTTWDYDAVKGNLGDDFPWSNQIATPISVSPPNSYSSSMYDSKSKGEWRFTDVSHVHRTTVNKVPSPFPPGELQPFVTFVTPYFGGRLNEVPVGHIIDTARKNHANAYTAPVSIEGVSKWFSNPNLPTIVRLSKDPMDSEFSLWFLLVDLGDLPRLVTQIFGRKLIRRPDLAGTRTIKQLADDQLMQTFGVIPTFRDISDFLGVLKRFRDGIEKFEEQYAKKHKWHSFVEDVTEHCPQPDSDEFQSVDLPGVGPLWVARVTHLESCAFRRTMSYKFTAPELRSWLSRLKQLIDLLGLLDPAALWDVIPFSFIADWFLPIGRWLHNNRPRLFRSAVEVFDYCESIKIQYSHRWAMFSQADIPGVVPRIYDYVSRGLENNLFDYATDLGGESTTIYLRRVMTPEVSKVGYTSTNGMLRLGQMKIASQLGAQRVPRPGLIGDEFDGLDSDEFRPPEVIFDSPEARREADANAAFAAKMRERRAAMLGFNPALWRFENPRQTVSSERRGESVMARLVFREQRNKLPVMLVKNLRKSLKQLDAEQQRILNLLYYERAIRTPRT